LEFSAALFNLVNLGLDRHLLADALRRAGLLHADVEIAVELAADLLRDEQAGVGVLHPCRRERHRPDDLAVIAANFDVSNSQSPAMSSANAGIAAASTMVQPKMAARRFSGLSFI
jgi:hypothetical protein